MLDISMAVSAQTFGVHAGHGGIGHMMTGFAIGVDHQSCALPGLQRHFDLAEGIKEYIFGPGHRLEGQLFSQIVGGMAFIAGQFGMGRYLVGDGGFVHDVAACAEGPPVADLHADTGSHREDASNDDPKNP